MAGRRRLRSSFVNPPPPPPLQRLKFTLAYDGASFSGWQSQAHGGAVQDALEKALARMVGRRVVVHGAGRTDAGVHALAQCAHAEVPATARTPTDWRRALNAHLPATLRILRVQSVPSDFHARFSARGKIYRYLIRTAPILPPLEVGRVWHLPDATDRDALAAAAGIFQGHHDFSAFSANRGARVANTQRTIHRVQVSRRGTLLALTFEGEGFLYKMVRMMVGAAARAARGRAEVDDLHQRLTQSGPRWNHVAPAEGLYLVRVLY